MLGKRSAPKWAVIGAMVLLLATTALAAAATAIGAVRAQSPDLLLPLVTGGGTQRVPAEQVAPEMPLPTEPDPAAPIGDSRDTHSGDSYQAPAAPAAIDAFNATQWTVQNNLGIGTQTPTEALDISRNVNNYTRLLVRNPNSGGAAQSQLYLNTGNPGVVLQQFGANFSASWSAVPLATRARLRTTPTSAGLIVTTGGAAPLILGTADQERMRITPDGNVGIGTTTPIAKLHVKGAAVATGVYVDQPGDDGVYVDQPGGVGVVVDQSGDFGLYVYLSGNDGVVVSLPNGDGVTVDSPSGDGVEVYQPGGYGLYVACPCGTATFPDTGVFVQDGNIRVQNGSFIDSGITLAVPDYVFEPEYPLMSLDELRAYVTEEKHLPNVPNEEEIRAGGLDLSEFQMKLLEKTEELTLYTLAQDDRINSQQQEIESLQHDNQAKDEELENQDAQLEALQQMIADLETRLAVLEAQE